FIYKIRGKFAPREGGIFLGEPNISGIGKDRPLKKGINGKAVFQIGVQPDVARLVEKRSGLVCSVVIATGPQRSDPKCTYAIGSPGKILFGKGQGNRIAVGKPNTPEQSTDQFL